MNEELIKRMCATILELEQTEILASCIDNDTENEELYSYTSEELLEMNKFMGL